MKKYLCINPFYHKQKWSEFQQYAISILYGDIVMGSDIEAEYADTESDEE